MPANTSCSAKVAEQGSCHVSVSSGKPVLLDTRFYHSSIKLEYQTSFVPILSRRILNAALFCAEPNLRVHTQLPNVGGLITSGTK